MLSLSMHTLQRLTPRARGVPTDSEAPAWRAMGAELRGAREARRLTVGDVAVAIGLSPASVASVERGRYRPRLDGVRAWLELLGLDADRFVEVHASAIAPSPARARRKWTPAPPRRRELAVRPPAPPPAELITPGAKTPGAFLWNLRTRRGLSRPELARLAGISRWHVWLVEHDLRHARPGTLARWLVALVGVDHAPIAAAFCQALENPGYAVGVPPGLSGHAPTNRKHPKRSTK